MLLASRGQRDMDAGPEAISDMSDLALTRRQALAVHAKSLIAAALLTVIAALA